MSDETAELLKDEQASAPAENGAVHVKGNGNGAYAAVSEPIDAEELQDRAVGLFHRGLPRSQFAAELLQMVAEAGGSLAGAVLTYNRRKHRLGLLAGHALSDEAREALEGGTLYSWDIPIRGLRNRRISVIESAHNNPFVPAAVVALSPDDLVVACIPVYHENLPAAAVLLFNTSAAALSDEDLHAITLAVRVGARGLREGGDTGAGEDGDEADGSTLAPGDDALLGRSVGLGEIDSEELGALRRHLASLREEKDALAARLERAEEDLARSRIEVERTGQSLRSLTASRQALQQERDRLRTEAEEIERAKEAEMAQLRADISSLEDRLMVAEAERLRHQRAVEQVRNAREQAVMALERERDGLLERVRGSESGIAAVQGALGSVREDRDRLAAQVDVLTRHLQTSQSAVDAGGVRHQQALAALEGERDTWKEQTATLQSEISRRGEEQRALEHALRGAHAAREAAADQLRSAQADLERLNSLQSEALERTQQAEAERAAAVAEAQALREGLVNERAEHQRNEENLRAELETAESAIERATAATATVGQRVAELERLLAERDAHVGRLEQERDLVGQDAQTIQQTLAQRENEAQNQLESLSAERDALSLRAQKLEQERSAESERAQAEARRAAAANERVTQFQQSLAQAEAKRTAMSGQLAQAQAELEALRQQSTDRGQLARQVSELSSKFIEQEKLLEAARDEARQIGSQLATAEKQRAALAKGLQLANREKTQAAAQVERDREDLRERLQKLEAEQLRLEKERAESVEALQSQRAAHAAALAEAQATAEQLRTERDRAVGERDQHASRIAAAQIEADSRASQALQDAHGLGRRLAERERRVDELSDVLRQRDADLSRLAEERRALSESVQTAETVLLDLRRELQDLREQSERQRREQAEALERAERAHKQEVLSIQRAADEREAKARQASLLALEERRNARNDAPLIIERSDDTGAVVESVPAALEIVQDGLRQRIGDGDIVILDRGALCDDAAAVLKGSGIEAWGAEPTEAGIERLSTDNLGAILMNVAPGPSAWELIRKLRERPATRHVPILAYLMQPEAANGFCFGRCDFGLWPNDLGDLVETLRRMRPMLRRILVASSDVEALGRVREPLAKAHISASNVLDGKQARDLGHSLQPEAAVLHFAPTCSDIARAIGSYRQIDATRDLPILLMLDKNGSARENIFFQAANRELLRTGRFDFSQLAEELVRLRTPK